MQPLHKKGRRRFLEEEDKKSWGEGGGILSLPPRITEVHLLYLSNKPLCFLSIRGTPGKIRRETELVLDS